jgi:hypothetical protein
MQVNLAISAPATTVQTGAATTVRVLGGNLASVPVGTLLQAMVTQVSQGQAVIVVNGQTLTVRTSGTLQPGAILLVRAPNGNAIPAPTLDIVGTATTQAPATVLPPGSGAGQSSGPTTIPVPILLNQPATATVQNPSVALSTVGGSDGAATQSTVLVTQNANSAAPTSQTATQTVIATSALPLARVDVLAVLPDGRVSVQIDGQNETATTTEQLAAGGRYVLQIERTSAGLTLSSAPDTPDLPASLSAAILRESSPPDLGAALKPLLAELANLQTTQLESTTGTSAPVLNAALAVRAVLDSFLPADSHPLNATELQNLVQDGGLHFEAKLARLVNENGQNPPDSDTTSTPNDGSTTRSAPNTGSDLKESLLRLLQAAQELGSSLQLPEARTTLDGIESQQAANVFAQTQGTPYILQIPFPDGGEWRTLHLAIEPDGNKRQNSGTSNGFRMLMHVPLTELGETWIDAGLSGNNLRAVLYLNSPAMREQVRTELPSLREELLSGGFNEVLLDVRAVSELPAQQRKQATAMQIGRPGSGSVLDVRA